MAQHVHIHQLQVEEPAVRWPRRFRNDGNTGAQTQNIAAILSWDPRKLIQQLLNLF